MTRISKFKSGDQEAISNFHRGFTLIELLITISIIFILVGVSFAGYSRLIQRQNLITAGLTVKNTLRDLQNRSYNSEMNCSLCNNCNPGNLIGWYLDLTNPSLARFYGKCGSNQFSLTPLEVPEGISINSTSPLITFKPFPDPSVDSAEICISNINTSNTYYKLSLNQAGIINDSGVVATCP